MSIKKTGDWDVAIKLTTKASLFFQDAANVALKREALRVEGRIKKNINKAKPGQASSTQLTGGLGKPLVRTGSMLNAVGVVEKSKLEVFVGIPTSSGLVNIANVHEEGATIVQRMSERMRRFLHAKLAGLGAPPGRGTGILVTRIPARPFIAPAVDSTRKGFARRFEKDFAQALGGKYGTA
jgi:hypothetical protein